MYVRLAQLDTYAQRPQPLLYLGIDPLEHQVLGIGFS
jgi:hypothetical protein